MSNNFDLFYKAIRVTKETVEDVSKEIDREIAHLSVNRVPYLKGRALSKILNQIQLLKETRDGIRKRFGNIKKNPFPTIEPIKSEDVKNYDSEPVSKKAGSEGELNRLIRVAVKREENDDHLSNVERKRIVDMWNELHPDEKKTGDLDDAFVDIIF